ncbi:hypothetical protein [Methylobacterium soli]|uniref:Uncharacterized protein n=1 Tax=Methylobacterium soli TaxID=553447 RepID=A0A6L3SVV9_9HYPH|nr:hypothetical protein [Methylobacterium soli]KAB1077908.1 hypothetical protein F6X53_17035 [Methylobacterium soli]GJE41587.1 hypothetical protein AEGHOMDF_0753 [Methylobacterium soli]
MSSPVPYPAPSRSTPRLRGQAHPAAIALRLGALLTFLLAAAPAHADSPFEGRYQGRGDGRLDLQVFDLGDGSGAHFVVAGTAVPNECTGELRGLAKPSGQGSLVLTRKESGSEEACTLTLRFGPDRKRARMEEQGCGDFHGTSCAFDGALTRR